ncbi:MAG: TetR/AcrR family transcriptional regulator [Terrisporobacter othiniensis]|uniref:TetR/AcrR family transcriptional regulator n=1 Tax=Terrisporobacter petrolearius TaxID=1460447 RepID=UPI0022E6CB4C|nr:TetR/AcrR family transcriptional regulator [Terrisporobacter petrolearius]MDU4862930.1 TetR/AcrR family transcriptional regulator [Terrisporobacter othiniensis]MDU6996890.1 TetR/AcrR family transcriptional regulator [Terrisporobacter othiniensis]
MGVQERRKMEKEKIKKEIHKAASEIIIDEGYSKLSIRKIASKIDYSPSLIYNYYENKADIVLSIWQEKSSIIINTMSNLKFNDSNEETNIKKLFKTYINLILESPEEYRAIMLNNIDIIKKANFDFTEEEKNSLKIKETKKKYDKYLEEGLLRHIDTEKYAFFSWISINGFVSNMVLSNNKDKEFTNKLIDEYLDFMIYGLFKNNGK